MDATPDTPWVQLPDETHAAYEAFCVYRDLGSTRSLAKVAHATGRKTPRSLERWSPRHRWCERAAAWDAEQERLRQAEFAAESLRIAREHAKQAASVRDDLIGMAQRLVQRLSDETYEDIGPDAAASLLLRVPEALVKCVRVERQARGMDAGADGDESTTPVEIHIHAPDNGRGPAREGS